MRYTKIAISSLFLFVALLVAMTTIQDTTRNLSSTPPSAAGFTQCQVDASGKRVSVPCASCTVRTVDNGTMTYACEVDCGGKACPGGKTSFAVAHRYEVCDTPGGACAGGTDGYKSSADLLGPGPWTANANAITEGSGAFPAVSCGRVQVDVQLTETGTSVAGLVYNTGRSCIAPTQVPNTPAPGEPTQPPAPTQPPPPPQNTTAPNPTRTPTPTYTPRPTETLTPTKTPTDTPLPTRTPTATYTPIPTSTPTATYTPRPTETPAPRCSSECGICGWKDSSNVCHESGAMPNGLTCCRKSCVNQSCQTVAGSGADSCLQNSQCVVPTTPPQVVLKCDARCGVCGVSNSANVCQDTTTLANGTPCCHNSCGGGQKCSQVSGVGYNECTTDQNCIVATLAPPRPITKPPVSGLPVPWYLILAPLLLIVIGVAL